MMIDREAIKAELAQIRLDVAQYLMYDEKNAEEYGDLIQMVSGLPKVPVDMEIYKHILRTVIELMLKYDDPNFSRAHLKKMYCRLL